jgi:hypothetical protein
MVIPLGCSVTNEDSFYREFYDDGSKKVVAKISSGMKNGSFVKYYENGRIHFKTVFQNDTLHGDYEEYYDNGQLKAKVEYRQGLKEGPQKDFFIEGSVKGYRYYEKDIPLYLLKFTKNGKVDWYQIGVKATKKIRPEYDTYWFKMPYTYQKSPKILGMVLDIRKDLSKDTLFLTLSDRLELTIDVPKSITDSYDSLIFEIAELKPDSSITEVIGRIPMSVVEEDTAMYLTEVNLQ